MNCFLITSKFKGMGRSTLLFYSSRNHKISPSHTCLLWKNIFMFILSRNTRFCTIKTLNVLGRTPRPPQSPTHFTISKWLSHTKHMQEKHPHPSFFLAHLSRRLEWAIVIARRPSVRRPASVRPSSCVRKLFTYSTSSPEPLDGFWWNLVCMKCSWSPTSVVVFRPDPPRGGSRAGQK